MDALNGRNLNGRMLAPIYEELVHLWESYRIDNLQLLSGLLHLRKYGWRI